MKLAGGEVWIAKGLKLGCCLEGCCSRRHMRSEGEIRVRCGTEGKEGIF